MNPQEMMEEIDRLARLCEAKDAEYNELDRHYADELADGRKLRQQLSEAQAQIAMQAEALNLADKIFRFEAVGECDERDILINVLSTTSETVAAWRAKETEPYKRNTAMLLALVGKAASHVRPTCYGLYEELIEAHNHTQSATENYIASLTEPLRREVAMLHYLKYELMGIAADVDSGNGFDVVCRGTLQRIIDTLSDTQATALAYEREVENRGAVKALELQWVTGDARPSYGEYVLVMTTNCDDDRIAVTANFNGKNLYLGVGGKKVSPVLGWMRIPELHAANKGEVK